MAIMDPGISVIGYDGHLSRHGCNHFMTCFTAVVKQMMRLLSTCMYPYRWFFLPETDPKDSKPEKQLANHNHDQL